MRGQVEEFSGECIISKWTNNNGYADHRKVYERIHGKIEPGLDVHHLCHNRACVNPEHLVLRTRAQNMAVARPPKWKKCPEDMEGLQ